MEVVVHTGLIASLIQVAEFHVDIVIGFGYSPLWLWWLGLWRRKQAATRALDSSFPAFFLVLSFPTKYQEPRDAGLSDSYIVSSAEHSSCIHLLENPIKQHLPLPLLVPPPRAFHNPPRQNLSLLRLPLPKRTLPRSLLRRNTHHVEEFFHFCGHDGGEEDGGDSKGLNGVDVALMEGGLRGGPRGSVGVEFVGLEEKEVQEKRRSA